MTNLEKWLIVTKHLPSPDSYIKFGFYAMIAMALQRRVWYYDERQSPLYCNLYITLVGPPAIGKGLVLSRVAKAVRYHKYERGGIIKTNIGDEKPLLFPLGADSITFEQLLARMADSARKHVLPDSKFYAHTSFGFILEELSSLFKVKTEDVVKFLLRAYDCDIYEYETKTQRKDRLRAMCLNFLAATQLDFLRDASKSGIFGQGFASRCIFVFETKRRFDRFHIIDDKDPDQEQAWNDLLAHLLVLSKVYGQITYDDGVALWIEEWYVKTHCPQEERAHEKMKDYLGRKKVTLLKLAAAIHFSESTDLVITQPTIQKALDLLNSIELQAEAGLMLLGRNPLHLFTKRILAFLKQQKETPERHVLIQFGADLNIDEIQMCLKTLEIAGTLKRRIGAKNEVWFTAI